MKINLSYHTRRERIKRIVKSRRKLKYKLKNKRKIGQCLGLAVCMGFSFFNTAHKSSSAKPKTERFYTP